MKTFKYESSRSMDEILSVTIQMIATEEYLLAVLFIILHNVGLTFESMYKILSVTIQMKATERFFPVVLFIMLFKVVLTFDSVDKILKCDLSNESNWAILCCSVVYSAVQGGSNF